MEMTLLEYFRHEAWYYSCITILAGSLIYNKYIPVVTFVSDTGLIPHVLPNDMLISKPHTKINRNDLVLVETSSGRLLVNRVYAIPGDEIEILPNQIRINGQTTMTGIFSVSDEREKLILPDNKYLTTVDSETTNRRSLPDIVYRNQLREVVDVLRLDNFTSVDWARLGLCTVFLLILIIVPYFSFFGNYKPGIFRKITIVPHSLITLYLSVLLLLDIFWITNNPNYIGARSWFIPFAVFSASDERILHELMFFVIFHSLIFYWPLIRKRNPVGK